jgi:hypothetical protein
MGGDSLSKKDRLAETLLQKTAFWDTQDIFESRATYREMIRFR